MYEDKTRATFGKSDHTYQLRKCKNTDTRKKNDSVQIGTIQRVTQGTDIYVAPGQEKHLPHEACHVVQQKQGSVRPTIQMKRVNDVGLEGVVQLANGVIQAYKCQECKGEINKQGRGHLSWCKAVSVKPTSTNHDRPGGKNDDDRHQAGLKGQIVNARQQNAYTHRKQQAGKGQKDKM